MRKALRIGLRLFIFLFIVANAIAFLHAYKFTHFTEEGIPRTGNESLSFPQKLKILFTGVDFPRPKTKSLPRQSYETVYIQSNVRLETWLQRAPNARGTVLIFHGYGGEKSGMLPVSDAFIQLGYNTLLVDFMGSGGSGGNQTTIGFTEAQEVKDCMVYLEQAGFSNLFLFGTSMGAVAIMKAVQDHNLQPSGLFLECPFGTMTETVKARFRTMKVPPFPMAFLLLFWGSVQNGYWTFAHDGETYAKSISCPVLLLYGEKDVKVSRAETDAIYANLAGPKKLVTFPLAGHESYIRRYPAEWTAAVKDALSRAR